jgi:hypothetical protein
MSAVINFVKEITGNEQVLIEIQGSLSHSFESKYVYMYLGRLKKGEKDVII